MVGASSNPDKASHGIMQKLQSVGYKVIPVNPKETEVLGERAYRRCSTSINRSTSSTSSGDRRTRRRLPTKR